MQIWKVLGLAGVAGVAVTAGVVAARRQRTWDEVDPDQLRAQLHHRLNNRAATASDGDAVATKTEDAAAER